LEQSFHCVFGEQSILRRSNPGHAHQSAGLIPATSAAQDHNPLSGAVSINVTMRKVETGKASFYGSESGYRTASGERFRPEGLTAAHRTRRMGSVVTVTNRLNGKSVQVRINDRGPAKWTGRVIDVSVGAARVLGMVRAGVIPVIIEE
jgi:rare lipoprotein A